MKKIYLLLTLVCIGILTACSTKENRTNETDSFISSTEENQTDALPEAGEKDEDALQEAGAKNEDALQEADGKDKDALQGVGEKDEDALQEAGAKNEDALQLMPTREQVLAAREIALEGMTEAQIERLTENIKVANLQMEQAYLNDDLFGKLEDANSLYWNYFDQKGEIQIGWEYAGTRSEIQRICEEENISPDEFYQKYGTPIEEYNRFHADNFIELMKEMQESVQNESFRTDLQRLMDEAALARDTHDVQNARNIYRILHDMDYFLLRYGIDDVGIYVKDTSTLTRYYNMLSIYQ